MSYFAKQGVLEALPREWVESQVQTASKWPGQPWAILHTLSHTLPLHDSHLNTGFLSAKIQANLARNKANKTVD